MSLEFRRSFQTLEVPLSLRATAGFLRVANVLALGAWCVAAGGCNRATPGTVSLPNAPAPRVLAASASATSEVFEKVTDFRVDGEVAEIVAAAPDGNTLVYTDSTGGQIGFVDIGNPAAPRSQKGIAVAGEPTSVAITPDGKWLLACVAGQPSQLLVFDFKTHAPARKMVLPGQPDCVAISRDGRFAALAIENQRGDTKKPLPQTPAGALAVVELTGAPRAWKMRMVDLRGLPLRFPTDPEPEYIAINARNQAAITLQENNGVAFIDLAQRKVLRAWSAGTTSHLADLKDDDRIDISQALPNAPREPDALAWTPRGNILVANEGDYDLNLKPGEFVGGRNATLFSPQGQALWNSDDLEAAIARAGFYSDKRSDKKGVEPEGVAVARFTSRGAPRVSRDLAFIGCERARCVVVYDIANESKPRLLQILPTGKNPEGLLSLPRRGLFVTANEGDGTISIFRFN